MVIKRLFGTVVIFVLIYFFTTFSCISLNWDLILDHVISASDPRQLKTKMLKNGLFWYFGFINE